MGTLKAIELCNFKSYRDTHRVDLGDSSFSAIIGPNGSGKSNMMDAISFVLGVRSSHLRSTQLKDLIYRGRIMRGEEVSSTQSQEATSAYVLVEYEKSNGDLLKLKRTITPSGSSEYRINNKVTSSGEYNATMKKENILVKARNFLVFQGDVEQIASQSPQDLSKLIEITSGSIDLKPEYDRLKEELDVQTERSNAAWQRRRTYNAEKKHYVELKDRYDAYTAKAAERDEAVVKQQLWKLWQAQRMEDEARDQIEGGDAAIQNAEGAVQEAVQEVENVAAKYASDKKRLLKQERSAKKRSDVILEHKQQLVPVAERIAVVSGNITRHEARFSAVEADLLRHQDEVKQTRGVLKMAQNNFKEHEQELSSKQKESGGVIRSDEDAVEYSTLKNEVHKRSLAEQAEIETVKRKLRPVQDHKRALEQAQEDSELKIKEFKSSFSVYQTQLKEAEEVLKTHQSALRTQSESLARVVDEQTTRRRVELELGDKLGVVANRLIELNAVKRQSERERRLKETVANLKHVFSAQKVHGLVYDLCKPKEKRHDLAVETILGKDIDSIVVDSFKTAQDCIAYLKEQQGGLASFIPLDTIKAMPVNSSLRSRLRGAVLAIDAISFSSQYERAFQYVCGSAIVCDDLKDAKRLGWSLNVKAVTTDGSVIHKAGLMTGGTTQKGNQGGKRASKWDESEVTKLQAEKDALVLELQTVGRQKFDPERQDTLQREVDKVRQEVSAAQKHVASLKDRLKDINSQLKYYGEEAAKSKKQIASTASDLEKLEEQKATIQARLDQVWYTVFSSYCSRVGVSVEDVFAYEQTHGSLSAEAERKRLRISQQIATLESQLKFGSKRVDECKERLAKIRQSIDDDKAAVDGWEADEAQLREDIGILEEKARAEAKQVQKLTASVQNASSESNAAKEHLSRAQAVVDNLRRKLAQSETELETAATQRYEVLRECKIEGIQLPLASGDLESVPLVEGDDSQMEVDVEVDFSSLPQGIRRLADDSTLVAKIKALQAELERINPNLKAVSRLEQVEAEGATIEAESKREREALQELQAQFREVRDARCDRFNAAFEHISGIIDATYKELTRSDAFPLGGSATLTVEDEHEPYLEGIKYHAMPPMKRFREMELLSGGEKTMAALALLFSIHSYHPSPFFVLDEIDAALDNANVQRVANYIRKHAGTKCQFIVISLKRGLYTHGECLVGIYRDQEVNSSKILTMDLRSYPDT
ncbi:Structural maintenance of chromosomes protein 1 [Yarrowia sp. C11]|nr:Structural maintenance of chromosomes protein 1 [Yarrowia sp. C11]KAG5370455.1 Structural maintenance of chromosomes protein 1 [Yarrowia sp. E02]